MANKRMVILSVSLVAAGGLALASGDWNATKSKVDDFKHKAEEVTRMAPGETRKVVAAICETDDDNRKSAGQSAASNARSHLDDKLNDVERAKREALDMLSAVQHDDALKNNRSEASSLESDVKSRWDKVESVTHDMRNGRIPVMDFMLSRGESARRDHLDHCDAKDVSLSSGHAECLIARGDTCNVVTMTADNSHAISKGRDRASRLSSDLNDALKKPDGDVMKHLLDRSHDFGKCKRFEVRVDCYKLCPDIGDDNRYSESSPSWRERC